MFYVGHLGRGGGIVEFQALFSFVLFDAGNKYSDRLADAQRRYTTVIDHSICASHRYTPTTREFWNGYKLCFSGRVARRTLWHSVHLSLAYYRLPGLPREVAKHSLFMRALSQAKPKSEAAKQFVQAFTQLQRDSNLSLRDLAKSIDRNYDDLRRSLAPSRPLGLKLMAEIAYAAWALTCKTQAGSEFLNAMLRMGILQCMTWSEWFAREAFDYIEFLRKYPDDAWLPEPWKVIELFGAPPHGKENDLTIQYGPGTEPGRTVFKFR